MDLNSKIDPHNVRNKGKFSAVLIRLKTHYTRTQQHKYPTGSNLADLNIINKWQVCSTYKYVKLATTVEGDSKAPFSLATTSRCRGRSYSFPSIALFTRNPYLTMVSVKQVGIKYHFLSLWYESLANISSSSSWSAGSMDIPDPLSPLLPIVHRPR